MTDDEIHGAPSLAERLQGFAMPFAAACIGMGLLAGGGCSALPQGTPSAAPFFHPLVFALGVVAGIMVMRRRAEIERWRWRTVNEDDRTDGERAYAHKEAERSIRWAGTVFLLVAVAPGYWLAYQLRDPERLSLADMLIVSPLVGFVIGLVVGYRNVPDESTPE